MTGTETYDSYLTYQLDTLTVWQMSAGAYHSTHKTFHYHTNI